MHMDMALHSSSVLDGRHKSKDWTESRLLTLWAAATRRQPTAARACRAFSVGNGALYCTDAPVVQLQHNRTLAWYVGPCEEV
jgi:Uma2 family endonuclease